MQNVTVFYKGEAAEVFEGVVGLQGGTNTLTLQTYDGKGTILHLENTGFQRLESVQIDDSNLNECSEEFQEWYREQEELAMAHAAAQQQEVVEEITEQ